MTILIFSLFVSSNFRAHLKMAEETTPELAGNNPEVTNPVTEDMELESTDPKGSSGDSAATNGDANSKREREENSADDSAGEAKKPKVETSVEEERLEKVEREGKGEEEEHGPVSLGPKSFGSSVELFDYFYKFLHHWPVNLSVNQYEQMVLVDLIMKGHVEPDQKVGCGITAFQIQFHPMWKSKCFFLIREDGSADDFSFRKCVDHILPLPENFKPKSDANRALGGGKHRGGGRGGGGRGRGGRWRN